MQKKHAKRKQVRNAVKKGGKVLKQVAQLGMELASEAKNRVANELTDLAEERIMSKQEAETLLKQLIVELREENNRVSAFAKKEFERTVKKTRPLVKKAVKRVTKGRKGRK